MVHVAVWSHCLLWPDLVHWVWLLACRYLAKCSCCCVNLYYVTQLIYRSLDVVLLSTAPWDVIHRYGRFLLTRDAQINACCLDCKWIFAYRTTSYRKPIVPGASSRLLSLREVLHMRRMTEHAWAVCAEAVSSALLKLRCDVCTCLLVLRRLNPEEFFVCPLYRARLHSLYIFYTDLIVYCLCLS